MGRTEDGLNGEKWKSIGRFTFRDYGKRNVTDAKFM